MPAHVLSRSGKSTRPSRLIFFDTETEARPDQLGRTVHTLKLGYAVACRTRRGQRLKVHDDIVFTSPGEFWDWVDRLCTLQTKYYLVAHNLNFDLPVLKAFSELGARGWELTSVYSKQSIGIYRWESEGRKLYALDNGNFFRGKLARWAEIINLPKLPIDFRSADNAELLTYCKRDVFILHELWVKWLDFLDDHECGKFGSTIAATAFNTYRHRFMPCDIWIDHTPETVALERAAYRGGRVEVLYQGYRRHGHFHYVDVNSMYGYIMQQNIFPAGVIGCAPCKSLKILERKLNNFAVVARVTVNVTDNWFPIKINDHTCYPLGEFTTTLTTPELILALKNDWIKEVHHAAWYRQAPLFYQYVNYFQSLKEYYQEQDNLPFAGIAKMFINSLYGKFGQLGLSMTKIGSCDPGETMKMSVVDIDHNEYYSITKIGGSVIREQKSGEGYNSFPAIAAHVTAYARIYLNRIRKMIPPRNVFYMDTDSLIIDDHGLSYLDHLLHPTQPGKLKIELSSKWLMVNAPKDYRMEGRTRVKGVRADAELIAPNAYLQDQWARIPGLIQDGNVDQFYTRKIIKHLRRLIYSGVVQDSGWVTPFVLSSGESD